MKDQLEDNDVFKMDYSLKSSYITKEEHYKNLKSTAYSFIAGAFASLFILKRLSTTISAVFIFTVFMGIAIHSYLKAKKIYKEIDVEKSLTKDINNLLENIFTKSFVKEHYNKNSSEEENYLHLINIIKKEIIITFGEQNPSYIEHIIEDFYSTHLE